MGIIMDEDMRQWEKDGRVEARKGMTDERSFLYSNWRERKKGKSTENRCVTPEKSFKMVSAKLPIKIKLIILLIKEQRKCFEYLKFILNRKITENALINIQFNDYYKEQCGALAQIFKILNSVYSHSLTIKKGKL